MVFWELKITLVVKPELTLQGKRKRPSPMLFLQNKPCAMYVSVLQGGEEEENGENGENSKNTKYILKCAPPGDLSIHCLGKRNSAKLGASNYHNCITCVQTM